MIEVEPMPGEYRAARGWDDVAVLTTVEKAKSLGPGDVAEDLVANGIIPDGYHSWREEVKPAHHCPSGR